MKLEIRAKRPQATTDVTWACYPYLPACSVRGRTKEEAYANTDLTVHVYVPKWNTHLPQDPAMAMA